MSRIRSDPGLRLELFATDVRRRRGALHLRELAASIGVSASTLSRVENEHKAPDLRTFAALCRWLGTDPGRYLGLTKKAGRA